MEPLGMKLPETAERLFAHVPEAVDESSGKLLIGRILEEGETVDLRWLLGEVGERGIAEWVVERGGRQLSRRSRCFWERILGVEATPPWEAGEALWPL